MLLEFSPVLLEDVCGSAQFWALSEISANRSVFGVGQRECDRDAAEPGGGGGAAGGGAARRAEEEGGGVRAGDPAAPPAADVQTEVGAGPSGAKCSVVCARV